MLDLNLDDDRTDSLAELSKLVKNKTGFVCFLINMRDMNTYFYN